jgi:hypothetical protein
MTQIVRNVGFVALTVKVIKADGTKGSFRLMPRNKGVPLRDNERVDPYWMAMEGQDIRIFDVPDNVPASMAQSSQEVKAASNKVKEA